jgi:hypothetical protein
MWYALAVGAAALLPAVQAAAAPFAYLKSLKEAEAAIGPLGVFSHIDRLSDAQRQALLYEKGGDLQRLGTRRSLAGDATGAAQAFSWYFQLIPPKPAAADDALAMAGAHAEDALEAIVEQAKERQIVILNEAHHVPQHRVFAGKLAHWLRTLGFEYLACETFDPRRPVAMEHGVLTTDTGYYSKEPMYANFLRQAQRDGWKFVPYEFESDGATEEEDMRLRELGEARNLMERIFANNPKARVLIYVGYAHAWERPEYASESQHAWLAAHLKHRLGTDPLTIDQSTMFAYPDRRAEDPLYRPALARFGGASSFVLKSQSGDYEAFGRFRGRVDMQVFHPDDSAISPAGRPQWMETMAGLHPRAVPRALMPQKGRRLIKAYHVHEGARGVPADMVMVEAGKAAPMLMLPAGKFRFTYEY